jgi:hypothetical protein
MKRDVSGNHMMKRDEAGNHMKRKWTIMFIK